MLILFGVFYVNITVSIDPGYYVDLFLDVTESAPRYSYQDRL